MWTKKVTLGITQSKMWKKSELVWMNTDANMSAKYLKIDIRWA